ncbi:hypothetical protein IG631_14250 [Alternaria alternata]|nr:hypothetical protein IG631_14250 [Alternaria alternata]
MPSLSADSFGAALPALRPPQRWYDVSVACQQAVLLDELTLGSSSTAGASSTRRVSLPDSRTLEDVRAVGASGTMSRRSTTQDRGVSIGERATPAWQTFVR